jgi:hypothetical protein
MMQSLIEEIKKTINTSVSEFVQNVATKYNLNNDDLMKMWDQTSASDTIQSSKTIAKPSTTKIVKEIVQKSPEGSLAGGDGCPYIYTKGEKEGQTCNIKPKGGTVFCTRHKKYEGTEPKQKKVLPSSKKSISPNSGVKKIPAVNAVNTVLRKNKALDKLWHLATGMVFKSVKERVVIGKCVDDKLLPLSSDDIEVCMAHGFAYENPEEQVNVMTKVINNDSDEDVHTPVENKAVRKITQVPSLIKKTLDNDQAKNIKKSIAAAISETQIQGEDVELILSELQIKSGPSKKKDMFDVSDNEDSSEEELLEEEDD